MPAESLLFSRFEANVRQYPDHPALIFLGERFTLARLQNLINRFATAAHALGIRRQDRVILFLQNSVQWVVAFFGLQKIGAVPVPVSPIYTAHEVTYMARHSEAVALVCQDTNFAYARLVADRSAVRHLIVTNLADLLPPWKRAVGWLFDRIPTGRVTRAPNVHRFRDLLRHPPTPPAVPLDADRDLAYILYTGGTTGFPKGVAGTHRGMVSFLEDVARLYAGYIRPREDVFVLVNPLFHIMANGMFLALGLNPPCTVVLMPQPHIDAVLMAIQRYRGTLFLGVPALYRMMLENDRLEQYDLRSLRMCWCGGDTLPQEVFRRWEAHVGVKIFQVYGSTEVGFVSMSPPDRPPSPRTIGRVLPSRRYRIVHPDTLQPVPPGEVGELLITSAHIRKSYWNNPEESARAFVELDGEIWYRMGDYVRQQGDEIEFVERSADIIKYKGYRISASEVEAALQDHPAVIGACVIGVPDSRVGERIKAIVVLREDARGVGAADLRAWCRQRLAPYKVPHSIEFRDMLPKSKVGKLLRREVRAEEQRRRQSE